MAETDRALDEARAPSEQQRLMEQRIDEARAHLAQGLRWIGASADDPMPAAIGTGYVLAAIAVLLLGDAEAANGYRLLPQVARVDDRYVRPAGR